MRRKLAQNEEMAIRILIALIFCAGAWAKQPKADAPFQAKLPKNLRTEHALDRLTFGQRPGDAEALRKLGLKKWMELQLHPERIREDPLLEKRLRPLETLRLSPLEIWQQYPQQQNILAVLNGKPVLPDDPILRAAAQRYAGYYKPAGGGLEPLVKLEDLLPGAQVSILRTGKPEQKRAILESIPEEKLDEFLVALGPQLRGRLQGIAPAAVRRRMFILGSPQQVIAFDLLSAKLGRAIYSRRQLEEHLVDFWYNHFNVYLDKGNDRYLVPAYEREAIRPHVLGRFRELLQATAESPAMLYYLDNFQSVAPPKLKPGLNPGETPKKNVRGINENYARELLELHTLGVDGGYTQNDIIEVARCFTGWTLQDQRKGSVFWFNEKAHDKGEKTVLGVTIAAGGGKEDGLQVLDILAHHPSTGRFVARKLAQRFVADKPPQALVERMAKTFREKDGDIREVLRTMLNSNEFWSKGAYHAKLKSPFEMIASAARAVNADVEDTFGLANQIATLGQPLYRKVEPTGYLNTSEEWINSASLLARMNFALNFAQNRLQGVKVPHPEGAAVDAGEIARRILRYDPSRQTMQAIAAAIERQKAGVKAGVNASVKKNAPVSAGLVSGLVIGSPEFQRR